MSALDTELTLESEFEGDQFLGGLLKGLGGALGLGESEGPDPEAFLLDQEDEGAYEDEGDPFLGGLLKGIGGALGLGESEYEDLYESEAYGEPEAFALDQEDEGEAFLPFLLPLAKVALPAIASALAGGGRRRESESGGIAAAPGTTPVGPQVMAEYLAAAAAQAPSEAEADAMVGAATVLALTGRERAQLQAMLPDLVRACVTLSRILRRRPQTRTVVRIVPTVVRTSAKPLVRKVQAGQVVTRPMAARVVAQQAGKVLTRPATARAVVARNDSIVRRATTAR